MNKCYSYFEEILEIQDERRKFREGLEYILELAEQKKVDKKTLDMTIRLWHTVEDRLRTQVTQVYDAAYEQNCFSETAGEEQK